MVVKKEFENLLKERVSKRKKRQPSAKQQKINDLKSVVNAIVKDHQDVHGDY